MLTLAFYFFAFFVLLSGLLVITSRNPVHSVLFLIFAFFNASGLFLLMGAEFLAMILIVVYVGAVAVLFLFVVMMVDIEMKSLRKSFALDFKEIFLTSLRMGGFSLLFFFFTAALFILFLNVMNMIGVLPLEGQAFTARVLISQPQTLLLSAPWKSLGIMLWSDFFSLKTFILGISIMLSVGGAIFVAEISVGRRLQTIVKEFIRTFPAAWFFAAALMTEIIIMVLMWKDARVTQDWIQSAAQGLSGHANDHITNTQALGRLLYTEYMYTFQISGLILLVAMIAAIILTLRHRTGVRRQSISTQVNRRKEDTLRLKDVPIGKGV